METIGLSKLYNAALSGYRCNDFVILDDLTQLGTSQCAMKVEDDVMLIALCKEGQLQADVNGQTIKVHSGQLFLCNHTMVLSNFMFSPDVKGVILGFDIKRLYKYAFTGKQTWYRLKYFFQHPIIDLKPDDMAILHNYYLIMRYDIGHAEEIHFVDELSEALLQTFLLQLASFTEGQVPQHATNTYLNSADHIYQRFMSLLGELHGRERSVTALAEKLNVTPKYLSLVVKKVSGYSPLFWAHYATIMQIEEKMRYTDMSIKQISVDLKFPSISFFGKFFKSHFGMSPTQYRRQLYQTGKKKTDKKD